MDRKDYRRADWLDCSERAIANITLDVELNEANATAFGRQILRILIAKDNTEGEGLEQLPLLRVRRGVGRAG
jgi:hypothetical protein